MNYFEKRLYSIHIWEQLLALNGNKKLFDKTDF